MKPQKPGESCCSLVSLFTYALKPEHPLPTSLSLSRICISVLWGRSPGFLEGDGGVRNWGWGWGWGRVWRRELGAQ